MWLKWCIIFFDGVENIVEKRDNAGKIFKEFPYVHLLQGAPIHQSHVY